MSRGPRYTKMSDSPLKVFKDGRMFEDGDAIAVVLSDIALDERERAREKAAMCLFPQDVTSFLFMTSNQDSEGAHSLASLDDLLHAIWRDVPCGRHCWIEIRRCGGVAGKGEYRHIMWQGDVLETIQESGEVLGLALAINATYQKHLTQY